MKVANTVFPLASSANRISLLLGAHAGTVDRKEIESAVLHDTGKRLYRKPVRAEGIYFGSVTDAAKTLVSMRHGRLTRDQFYRLVQAEVKRISRKCTQDCWEGYYWEN
jgi:hypothetical protein